MIDNGSTGSIYSEDQLDAYRKATGQAAPMRNVRKHSCFLAHGGSKCIGIATICFPSHDTSIKINVLIASKFDSSMILGLREMDRLGSTGANQLEGTISFRGEKQIKTVKDQAHIWIRWDYATESLFTEAEVAKLHYRFGHPSVQRMHDFLKRVRPIETDKDTPVLLESIRSKCKECQFLAPKPFVVKVSVPQNDIVFNHEVIMDTMYIQGKTWLHVVDRGTHFQAARFLNGDSSEEVWQTFMQMWTLTYVCAPNNLKHDQGSQFISPKLQAMAGEAGISCRLVGVEAPHPMSVGERYHAQKTYGLRPLDQEVGSRRRTGRPKKFTQKGEKTARVLTVDDHYLLSIAVMCVNTTVGPEGLCPTLLVFGAMPKLLLPGSLPAATPQGKRMMLMENAREEYMKIVAEMRLKRAAKAFVHKTLSVELKYGDKVLVYRDTTRRWESRTFVSRNDHSIIVIEPNGYVQPYATTAVC